MSERVYTVYRLSNADGELLYVGCSLEPFRRLYMHSRTARSLKWWEAAATCTFEHFTDKEAALECERRAILSEAPRFNVRVDGPKLVPSGLRKERVAAINAFRAQGLTYREIGEAMGLAVSTVSAYLCDPDGSGARARKAAYGGACEICGEPTNGHAGRGKSPKRCRRHMSDRPRRWAAENILDAIRAWADEHGSPPAHADWNPYSARVKLHDEERARYFEESGGRWPHFQTVVQMFGTWSAAMEAAGFEPRAAHGGDGNELRRRDRQEAA